MNIIEVTELIRKEILIEFRRKSSLGGLILYTVSALFIFFLTIKKFNDPAVINAILWITILFGSVNVAARSFIQEGEGSHFYFYTLVSSQTLIISKIIYNFFIIVMLSFIASGAVWLWSGNLGGLPALMEMHEQRQAGNFPEFLLIILLGSTGLSTLLTFVSSISSKSTNQPMLMAILSFPLILPLLMVVIRLTEAVFEGSGFSEIIKDISILASLDIIIITLAIILFPYLWKE
ncbi:MAG: heme exporter protein CcmB [Bacteroidetes bacterium]|nr:heme exporter protein CcmB [Bacteroidota bacterium]